MTSDFKIEMGGRYIRRDCLDANGQPKLGAVPVRVLTVDLDGTHPVMYQCGGLAYRITLQGDWFNYSKSEFDLLPWPEEPPLVAWTDISQVPLDAWFRDKCADSKWEKVCAVYPALGRFLIGSRLVALQWLFGCWEWTTDFKTIHPCGSREGE